MQKQTHIREYHHIAPDSSLSLRSGKMAHASEGRPTRYWCQSTVSYLSRLSSRISSNDISVAGIAPINDYTTDSISVFFDSCSSIGKTRTSNFRFLKVSGNSMTAIKLLASMYLRIASIDDLLSFKAALFHIFSFYRIS